MDDRRPHPSPRSSRNRLTGTRSELVDALVHADSARFERLRTQLGANDRTRVVADAIAAVSGMRRGRVPLRDALGAVQRGLAISECESSLLVFLLSSAIMATVGANDLDSARHYQERLAPLLDACTDIEIRAYGLGVGIAQFRGAADGPASALAVIDQALALGPVIGGGTWCTLKQARAHAQVVLNEVDGAIADLEEVAARQAATSPGADDTNYLFAMAYVRAGRAAEAIDMLDRLEAAGAASHTWLLVQRAQALMSLKRFPEAEVVVRRYRESLVSAGRNPDGAANLEATLAVLQGQLERARTLVRRALADATSAHVGMPTPARAEWALALQCTIELASRQPRAARRVLLMLDPSEKSSNYAMEWARLYLLEGNLEEAAAHFARAEDAGSVAMRQSLEHAHELLPSDLIELQRRAAQLREPGITGKPQPAAVPQDTPRPHRPAGDARLKFVGISPAAVRIREMIDRLAPLDAPVLITGETGTGKEVVARLLHAAGPRAGEPFIPVNCAGLSDTLVESELFGHVKGAFTGASDARTGLFEAAGGGTIFLDEFHAISPRLQVALLRALEDGEVRPVGGNDMRRFNARVVVAANPMLRQLVDDGRFRGDLYFRVARLCLNLQPLRERREDIPLLVNHFLDRLYGRFEIALDDGLIAALQSRSWPGNVRELRNEIERLVLFAGSAKLLTADLLREVSGNGVNPSPDAIPTEPVRPDPYESPGKGRQARRRAILDMLTRHDRITQQEVVRTLGCAPNTARADLAELESEGRIVRINPTPHPRTAYFVRAPISSG